MIKIEFFLQNTASAQLCELIIDTLETVGPTGLRTRTSCLGLALGTGDFLKNGKKSRKEPRCEPAGLGFWLAGLPKNNKNCKKL